MVTFASGMGVGSSQQTDVKAFCGKWCWVVVGAMTVELVPGCGVEGRWGCQSWSEAQGRKVEAWEGLGPEDD